MNRYEYMPDFEPHLIKISWDDDTISCRLGLQAINVIEGDEFNWYAKIGADWLPLSVVFGKTSFNVFHYMTYDTNEFEMIVRLKVKRDSVELVKQRTLILSGVGSGIKRTQWQIRVDGFMYHRIRFDGDDTKFGQSDLGINKTPFVVNDKLSVVFPLIKSESQLLLEKSCGGR